MKTTKSHRITKWLNIFLLTINITAFVTILYINKQPVQGANDDRYSSDQFLKKELNLNEEQYQTISSLDNKVFRSYQVILDKQCESNFKILNELLQEEPSLERLDSIAIKTGKLHTALKRQTIKHFINIKNICDENQTLLLDQLLMDMMNMPELCSTCNKRECDRRNRLNKK
jgi:hypothetical protein